MNLMGINSFTFNDLEVMIFALQLLEDVLSGDKDILTPAEVAVLDDVVAIQSKIQSALHSEAIGA